MRVGAASYDAKIGVRLGVGLLLLQSIQQEADFEASLQISPNSNTLPTLTW